ncbi:MAG: DMT family transporter [Frankiaceae bacterium]
MTGRGSRVAGATASLVVVTAIWGSTFPIVKHSIEPDGPMTVLDFLAWRFALAAVAMLAVRPRSVVTLGAAGRRHGAWLGLALGSGYVAQTIGLQSTPAGVSGFVTGMFVVLTPLVGAVALRRRVPATAWLAVTVATAGLALLSIGSISGQHGSLAGIAITFCCAVAFAVHIVGLGEWSHRHDAVGLAVVQLATVTLICAVAAVPAGDGLAPPPTAGTWFAIAVTALAATAFAFFVQTWAQSILDPTRTAVIMTMEPVFAGLFAVWLAGESMGLRTLAGSILVLGAMFLVELGPRSGSKRSVSRLET